MTGIFWYMVVLAIVLSLFNFRKHAKIVLTLCRMLIFSVFFYVTLTWLGIGFLYNIPEMKIGSLGIVLGALIIFIIMDGTCWITRYFERCYALLKQHERTKTL
jgi:hypothetical protein